MKRLFKLLGFVILGIILWRTDVGAMASVLGDARFYPLFVAFGVSMISIGFKAWRWKSMLSAQGFSYPIYRAFRIYMSGIYIGLATPGRLGELARVLYVKRDFKTGAGVGLSSVIMDRMFDLYALMAAGLIASFQFGIAGRFSIVFLFAVVGMLLGPLLFLSPKFGLWFSRSLLGKVVTKKFGKVLAEGTEQFFAGIEQMISIRLVWWGALTLAAYLLFFYSGFLLCDALGIQISFLNAALILGMANLLSLVPITVAGVGTRDAVFVFAFASLSLAESQALAFSALVLATFFLAGGAVGFVCFILDRPPAEDAKASNGDALTKPSVI